MPNYNTLTPELIELLRGAAKGHLLVGEEINEDYSHDEMPIYGKYAPDVLLKATSAEEIAAVMKICNENRIPVIPRGAGTGLVGGCVPIVGGVMIDLSGMNKILRYDFDNFTVTIQPGVLLQDLGDDCLSKGYLYPPDPGMKLATLGGNVSTNAGGMRAVKYGTTRDYVLAMQVVLPTGEITRFGAAVNKTSSGYSLLNLMVGSEGTLGIITELTLKIIPAPKKVVSLVIPFKDLDSAIATVPKIKKANLGPQALEFMERDIVVASEHYVGRAVFPQVIDGVTAGAYLLLTFDADDQESLDDMVDRCGELVMDEGALDVLVANTPDKIRDAWAARSSFLEAIKAETKFLDECDVVVPINQIASFLSIAQQYGEEFGLVIKSFGHAGDGNIHIYQCSNDLDEEEFKRRVDEYFVKLYAKAVECGGLVSGEHGIGHSKVKYLEETIGAVNIGLMEGIKKLFDPNMILNPGKVCYTL